MSLVTRKLVMAAGLFALVACSNAAAPESRDHIQPRYTATDSTTAGATESTPERGGNLMGSGH